MTSQRWHVNKGDPLAMPLYALHVVPLISKSLSVHQIWYATAVGKLHTLWDYLQSIGPGIGYFPQAVKIWLLIKPHFHAITSRYYSCRQQIDGQS